MKLLGEEDPRSPGNQEEKSRESETARGAARQNDSLESVEQDGKQADNAGDQSQYSHWSSSRWSAQTAFSRLVLKVIVDEAGHAGHANQFHALARSKLGRTLTPSASAWRLVGEYE